MPFGEELVHYAIGPASFAVPGGAGRSRRAPRALRTSSLARSLRTGAAARPRRCPDDSRPGFLPRDARAGDDDGRRRAHLRARATRCFRPATCSRQPGIEKALALLAYEGARFGVHRLARAVDPLVHAGRGGAVTADDLAAYEARWSEPLEVEYAGTTLFTRGGLAGLPELMPALPGAARDERDRASPRLVAPPRDRRAETHTTNTSVVDAEGNACVITTSLGLGSGDFLPGLDLHLNSMLGEVDLIVGDLVPGERMSSMMAPTLAFDADGLALALGAAGGTRLRTALALVLSGVLDEGLAAAGRGRPAALPRNRRRRQCRGRSRRGGARPARSRRPRPSGAGPGSTTTSAA